MLRYEQRYTPLKTRTHTYETVERMIQGQPEPHLYSDITYMTVHKRAMWTCMHVCNCVNVGVGLSS